MTKEEEKAIEMLKNYKEYILKCGNKKSKHFKAVVTVLNMLKEKDKQIDLMANFMIAGLEDIAFNAICKKSNCIYELRDNRSTGFRKCKNCIKQYFKRKVKM